MPDGNHGRPARSLQKNNNSGDNPWFLSHHYLFGGLDGTTIRNPADGGDTEPWKTTNIFWNISHDARVLWNASNTQLNAETAQNSAIQPYVSSSVKMIAFQDRSPYWHYPKVGYQYAAVNNQWKQDEANQGFNTDTKSTYSNFYDEAVNGIWNNGIGDNNWISTYTDTPNRHTNGQFIFYDHMWLYKWTKLCDAAKDWDNKGSWLYQSPAPSGNTKLWNYDSSFNTIGFSSFTSRPWGCIDGGNLGNSTLYGYWQAGASGWINDASGPFDGTVSHRNEAARPSIRNIGSYGSKQADLNYESDDEPGSGGTTAGRVWFTKDPTGSIAGRAWPFERTYGAYGGSYNQDHVGLGPYDNTHVRFDPHIFTGEYHAVDNTYGQVRGLDGSLSGIEDLTIGSGCGWTGLMDLRQWNQPYNQDGYFDSSTVYNSSSFSGGASIAAMQNSLGPRTFPKMWYADKDAHETIKAGHVRGEYGYTVSDVRQPKIAFPRNALQRIPGHNKYCGIVMGFRGTFVSIFSDGLRIFQGHDIRDDKGVESTTILPFSRFYPNAGGNIADQVSNPDTYNNTDYTWMNREDGGIPSNARWFSSGFSTGGVNAGGDTYNDEHCSTNVACFDQYPNKHSWYFPQRFSCSSDSLDQSYKYDSNFSSPKGLALLINREDCGGVETASDENNFSFTGNDGTLTAGTAGTDAYKFPHIKRTAETGVSTDDPVPAAPPFWSEVLNNSPLKHLTDYLQAGETGTNVGTNAVVNGPKNVCYNNTKKRMYLLVNYPVSPTGAGGIWGNTATERADYDTGECFWSTGGAWRTYAAMLSKGASAETYKYYVSSPLAVSFMHTGQTLPNGWKNSNDPNQFPGFNEYHKLGGGTALSGSVPWYEHQVGVAQAATSEGGANFPNFYKTRLGAGAREMISPIEDKFHMGGTVINQLNVLDPESSSVSSFDPKRIHSIATIETKSFETLAGNSESEGPSLIISYADENGGYRYSSFWLGDFLGDAQGGTLTGGRHVPWGVAPP